MMSYRRPSPEPYQDRRKRRRSYSPDFHDAPPRQRFAPMPPRPRVPPPETLPYLVSRRHFEDYLHDAYPAVFDDKPRLDEAWTRYKSDFLRKYYLDFAREHGAEPWFQERYDPVCEELRSRLRLKGTEGNVDKWLELLTSGQLQNLSYDAGAPNKDTLSPSTSEGEPTGTAEPMNTEQSADADTSVSNGEKPSERSRPSDETLPVPTCEHQLVIKSVSAEISREALEKHCAQAPGFDYLAYLDPNPTKRFHRVAFVNFKPDTDMNRVEEILFESNINNFTLHMNRATQPGFQRIRQFPGVFNDPDRIRKDLAAAKAFVSKLEKDIKDERATPAIAFQVEQWEMEGVLSADTISKRTLDLYLHLLRTVFHACYYCGLVCEFSEELTRKCIRHVRRPLVKEEKKSGKLIESDLFKITDEKIHFLTEPSSINARQHGGEDYEIELGRLCAGHVRVEEPGKFRCVSCSKLFKAPNFVDKHILNKHPELVNMDALNKIRALNNYVLDPNRIMPSLPQPPDPSRPPPPPPPMASPHGYSASPYGVPMYPILPLPPSSFAPPMPPVHNRLSERIGDRVPERGPKNIAPLPPASSSPQGARQDPRAKKVASYNDLDSSVPSGEGELDY